MDNEPYRDLSHLEAQWCIVEQLHCQRRVPIVEAHLPDKRIADVLALDMNGDIHIYEVKTEWKPSFAESAWNKYGRWSNFVWIVVPGLTAQRWGLQRLGLMFAGRGDACGVAGIDRLNFGLFRRPTWHRMVAENRQAVLELFPKP